MRVGYHFMDSPCADQLADGEFRAYLALLAYVAHWRADVNGEGTFPLRWHTFVRYGKTGKRAGKVTPRHVGRFIELGILDHLFYDDGAEFLRFRDWKDLVPNDPTGAERAARFRERHGLYGRRPRRYDDPPTSHELEIPPHRQGGV